MHDLTGLPWGITISLTAILIRSCFSVASNYAIFRSQRKQLLAEPLVEAYRNAKKTQTKVLHEERKKQQPDAKALSDYVDNNATLWVWTNLRTMGLSLASAAPLLYLPVWARCCITLNEMCGLGKLMEAPLDNVDVPAPSLTTEGLLWFTNLTAFDPILSTSVVVLLVFNAWSAAPRQATFLHLTIIPIDLQNALSKVYKPAAILLSAMFGVSMLAAHNPAAVALYQASSSLCALVTRSVMWRVMLGRSGRLIEPARRKAVRMRTI